jgi:hypothetical protein
MKEMWRITVIVPHTSAPGANAQGINQHTAAKKEDVHIAQSQATPTASCPGKVIPSHSPVPPRAQNASCSSQILRGVVEE